jgi:hypothetical protein
METENRKFPRRGIDLSVQIETADGSTIRCSLSDLSQGGVRLKVKNPDSLPEQFMLTLSSTLRRRCRIAWRSSKEVGVEFLSAPQDPADERAKCSVLIKCPRTGKNISTGIQLTVAGDFSRLLSGVRRFTRCPHCNVVHGWVPSDASLGPASGIGS